MLTKSIKTIQQALISKEVSSVELTKESLSKAKALNQDLNCFISLCEDHALQSAKTADLRRSKGESSPLLGIPIAHKDLFCIEGLQTTCASKMLENFTSPYTATAVENLSTAGMVTIGKTNMDEFAMGSSNETSYFGACHNPWDLKKSPGGSSGGSAACVSAGIVPASTGSDTGGSIRQPASFCNLTGLKPSYGRISRWGMIAFASSLDQGGLFAKSSEDIAYLLSAIAGFDPKDSTSVDRSVPKYEQQLETSLQGKTIGLPKEFFTMYLDSKVADVIYQTKKSFESLGAKVIDIELPNMAHAVSCYYIIAPAECSSNLSRYDGIRYGHRSEKDHDLQALYKNTREEGFGLEVKRRILIGSYVLSSGYYDAYYTKAQKVRRLILNDFQQAFEKVDFILGPTTPTAAFMLDQKKQSPTERYLADVYTTAVNLAGLPALSMPAGFVDGMPVGAQLIGPSFEETLLLNAAHKFQSMTDFHLKRPPLSEGAL